MVALQKISTILQPSVSLPVCSLIAPQRSLPATWSRNKSFFRDCLQDGTRDSFRFLSGSNKYQKWDLGGTQGMLWEIFTSIAFGKQKTLDYTFNTSYMQYIYKFYVKHKPHMLFQIVCPVLEWHIRCCNVSLPSCRPFWQINKTHSVNLWLHI